MKKVVVVGGSNGIGLAIVQRFMEMGLYVHIFDRVEPASEELNGENYFYHFCDLIDFDENLFCNLSCDESVEALVITAGFGRVTRFENLHSVEIQNMLTVNTSACIQTIRCFYERINCKSPFYCGVMGSIAGFVSSPMFSVYAASKAALVRFVESVNVELELNGTQNRILNVSPGSIKGTRFNGGSNDLSMTAELADEIIKHLYARDELYIPQYEEIYRGVIERYHQDSHGFGVQSMQYKLDSGRVQNGQRAIVGYLSGTFDLFHIGHLNLIRRAKEQCDYLIVGVHPNAAHKGKQTFISFEERLAIVGACRYVDKAVQSCQDDSDAWELYHFDRLFVGSDYKGTERFKRYEAFFMDKNVEIIYFPYTQVTSSTQLRNAISKQNEN